MKTIDEMLTLFSPILQQGWSMRLESPWATWDTWTCEMRRLEKQNTRYPQVSDDSDPILGTGKTAADAMAECLEAWREEYAAKQPDDGREVENS